MVTVIRSVTEVMKRLKRFLGKEIKGVLLNCYSVWTGLIILAASIESYYKYGAFSDASTNMLVLGCVLVGLGVFGLNQSPKNTWSKIKKDSCEVLKSDIFWGAFVMPFMLVIGGPMMLGIIFGLVALLLRLLGLEVPKL